VYRTTVASRQEANRLIGQLRRFFPDCCISFDLEDCDRVLRVESPGDSIPTDCITALLQQSGYECEPLPD
jgi:hypothetical protein